MYLYQACIASIAWAYRDYYNLTAWYAVSFLIDVLNKRVR